MPDPLANPTETNPIVDLLSDLVDRVKDAIENQLLMRPYIETQGGPYQQSLTLNYEKKLHEAAVAAIETIVNHPAFQQPSAPS